MQNILSMECISKSLFNNFDKTGHKSLLLFWGLIKHFFLIGWTKTDAFWLTLQSFHKIQRTFVTVWVSKSEESYVVLVYWKAGSKLIVSISDPSILRLR